MSFEDLIWFLQVTHEWLKRGEVEWKGGLDQKSVVRKPTYLDMELVLTACQWCLIACWLEDEEDHIISDPIPPGNQLLGKIVQNVSHILQDDFFRPSFLKV